MRLPFLIAGIPICLAGAIAGLGRAPGTDAVSGRDLVERHVPGRGAPIFATSLAAAFASPPGSEVHLPPGRYRSAADTRKRARRLTVVCDGTCVVDGGLTFKRSSNVSLVGHFVFSYRIRVASGTEITLDGVEVTNSRAREGSGVSISNYSRGYPPSRSIVVRNSWIHDTNDDGFSIGRAHGVRLERNRVERAKDRSGGACAGRVCHSDALHIMGRSTAIVVTDNDFSGNVIAKTDFGAIELRFHRNRVHDSRNWGITLFRMPGTSLTASLVDNHAVDNRYGDLYTKGGPRVEARGNRFESRREGG